MTIVRGLREALLLFVIAGVLVAVAAGIWVAVAGGEYTTRLGIALIVVGGLLGVTGDLTMSRIGMLGPRAIFGAAGERETAGGGRVLTGVGIFLFVGLPLIVVGVLLID
ncbi:MULTISPECIES: hypothetical protein [Micromonospora]|uniref:Uncharacterized protein n=2 Tax=Micromonospora TaxID=1873 RepID=A0A1C4VQ08_9ACTN|nr:MULTISPECIES: hypothetical protein [Micromonospora]RAN95603.1 hypothetical protein GAR05_04268 [Micromonospora saelicesensis]RAO10388.1 hypothetical protein MED15_05604 [Micromonospora noduli]RAO41520.1 hypothetical protein GAR06_05615 [Micromonospora saelicesensis]RAO59151.1 hypothetical protein LUPAC06_02099 [Micromonospora saelicesensis]RAO59321.1 hypothetical protein ONO86_00025 [Micromonospora noduli]